MRFLLILMFALVHMLPAAQPKFKPLVIGVAAPDFELKGVDGKMHRLADYKSKVLAIVFNCNHCPTAQAYEPRMIQMVKDYQGKDFQLLVISSADPKSVRPNELGFSILDDGYEAMVQRSKDMKYNFPYLDDGVTQKVTKAYGPTCTPHIFIFGADRKLQYQGRIDNDERKAPTKREAFDAIDALLAGKEVAVKTTRAFGCSTKWDYKRSAVIAHNENWLKEDVKLEDIDEVGLKKLVENKSDTIKIINVWATFCGPCIAEFPGLVGVNRQFEYRGVELITLSTDSMANKKRVEKFLKSENAGITARIKKVMKKEGRTGNNFIINVDDRDKFMDVIDKEWSGALPHTLVILPGGKVLFRHTGELDSEELKKVLIKHLGSTYK